MTQAPRAARAELVGMHGAQGRARSRAGSLDRRA